MSDNFIPIPPRVQDLTGKRFGKYLVLGLDHINRFAMWLCLCDCGNKRIVRGSSLNEGVKACPNCSNMVHGHSKRKKMSREYSTWAGIIKRCTNKNEPAYKDYGGRGITVCYRWITFANFLADMGKKPTAKHTIDRIDNDKGYSPKNCRWATRTEQNRNTRKNRFVTFNGQTMTVAEWEQKTGITNLHWRLKRWSLEDAITKQKQNPWSVIKGKVK